MTTPGPFTAGYDLSPRGGEYALVVLEGDRDNARLVFDEVKEGRPLDEQIRWLASVLDLCPGVVLAVDAPPGDVWVEHIRRMVPHLACRGVRLSRMEKDAVFDRAGKITLPPGFDARNDSLMSALSVAVHQLPYPPGEEPRLRRRYL